MIPIHPSVSRTSTTNASHTDPSLTKPSLADSLPVDEHPDDPDRDFNEREENYLYEIVRRLRAANNHTLATRLAAVSQVATAEEDERALWDASAFYLNEATLWHRKQTGQSQLHVPDGILSVTEKTDLPQITNPEELHDWVQNLWSALLPLLEVTSRVKPRRKENETSESSVPGPVTNEEDPLQTPRDLYWTWEESDTDHSIIGARRRPVSGLQRAVANFHAATGILPGGCQSGETRTVVRLS